MKNMINTIIGTFLICSTSAAYALIANSPTIINNTVDSALINLAETTLPESTTANPEFLNTDYDPYLSLHHNANVYVSFLDEGAGYKNSLGYFTFNDDTFSGLNKGSIDTDSSGVVSLSELGAVEGIEYGFLFANLSKSGSGGSLLTGDTVQVGDSAIALEKNVSFFLSQNSYAGGDTVSDGILTGTDQTFYGLDFLNPEADFTYENGSSSATSRHVAMLFTDNNEEQVIMGFEDLNRVNPSSNDWSIPSDEDFNDAIFMVYSDPVDAFSNSNIATAPLPPMAQSLFGLMMCAGLILITQKNSILIPLKNTNLST
ncbi:DUF4114 domain-containing protein [Candidatus Enterovibrio altilux]|uniref:DUF4114 domain-containing protein n=1 Tax=Candidatus Enterovibrio altilux TaxID=1927128 RepID=A0A291B7R7_9GAMM|nr:DUF4114 domain-containing protein [Candidatus Enterovibrio luxaltus]ATF09044.1 hypothetical protein BTN50_0517 [Candidatus Enterovibrio luxaltus]